MRARLLTMQTLAEYMDDDEGPRNCLIHPPALIL